MKRLNEKGSVSILFAMGVAAVGGLMIFQLSSMFNMVNLMHAKQKTTLERTEELHRLGVLLKHSYDLAQMYPNCNGVKSEDPTPKKIKLEKVNIQFSKKKDDEIALCLPKSKEMCVPSSDGSSKSCISMDAKNLNWKIQAKGLTNPKALAKFADMPGAGKAGGKVNLDAKAAKGVMNSITIPDKDSSPLWRSCSLGRCFRLVLCPNERTTCTLAEASAVQVVRFGNLEKTLP